MFVIAYNKWTADKQKKKKSVCVISTMLGFYGGT